MGYPQTRLIQPLGTQAMQASGSTQGVQLSNLAIQGLTFLIQTTPASGTTAESVETIVNEVDRIRVNVDGSDDYNLSGVSLYALNRYWMNGEEVPNFSPSSDGTRALALYLPFELIAGLKSTDTLLDLRPRGNGSLPQGFVQFDTSLTASHSGSIRIFEHYYNYGSKARKTALRKQLIQKTLTMTAGGSFVLPIDYGSVIDDIARMYMFIENGGSFQSNPFRTLKLSASEGTQYDVFDLTAESGAGYVGLPWIFNKLNPIADNLDAIVTANFLASDGRGSLGKLSGALDASLMTNLVLSGVANQAGTLHVVLERANIGKAPEMDPYGGGK